jgi:hypothetical protein
MKNLGCNSYILGCAMCEVEEAETEEEDAEIICTACDYNYFLITVDDYSYCTIDCSAEEREFIHDFSNQQCQGNIPAFSFKKPSLFFAF